MTNELTQLSSKQRLSLSPLTTVFAGTATEPLVTHAKLPVASEGLGARGPALGSGMGLFVFASWAFFPGAPTHAQNEIKGEWERSAWQSCQRVNVLKRSGFQGAWHGPAKVTQKDRVSWDIYLDLCFKSLEERRVLWQRVWALLRCKQGQSPWNLSNNTK